MISFCITEKGEVHIDSKEGGKRGEIGLRKQGSGKKSN